ILVVFVEVLVVMGQVLAMVEIFVVIELLLMIEFVGMIAAGFLIVASDMRILMLKLVIGSDRVVAHLGERNGAGRGGPLAVVLVGRIGRRHIEGILGLDGHRAEGKDQRRGESGRQ